MKVISVLISTVCQGQSIHGYPSTVYWCTASKLKVPLFFFIEWTTRFCVLIDHFSISLTLVVLQRHKNLPNIGGTTIQDDGCLAAMRLAMESGVHTLNDELILKISCNIFLAFKWISMMRWGQNISHYMTAKPFIVKSWSDLVTKQNWYTQNISTRLRLRALKHK